MEAQKIRRGDSAYPEALVQFLRERAPASISATGNLKLLSTRPLALFCSVKCPGTLILQTYDLVQQLRDSDRAVIGGFHSPVERECLITLLRGKNPIVICLARGIESMRLPKEYQGPLEEKRVLLLSTFSEKVRRADTGTAASRNAVVAALAHEVFVAHAEPRSKTEILCRDIISWGKSLYTFENSANHDLLALGAKALSHGQSQLVEVYAP